MRIEQTVVLNCQENFYNGNGRSALPLKSLVKLTLEKAEDFSFHSNGNEASKKRAQKNLQRKGKAEGKHG